MVLRKLSQSFRIGTAFLLAVLSTGILQTMPVYATNNGTLKVHEVGTASGTESNDPKVCAFNFEGFGFDAGQEGYVVVEPQGGDSDTTDSAILSFGPASAAGGYYMTTDLNNGGDTLDQGHYKATLYGKDVHGVNLQDEKAKSKNFKVTCSAEAPTATATVKSCTPNSGTTDVVSVRVFNTDDGTNATVVYTVKLGNQTKTIELADGANGNVEFGGLAAGTYTATVTGSDGTAVTLSSITVGECPFITATPTATATVVSCTLDSNTTDKVSVRVFNTDDGTDATVTYTIKLGGQTKTIELTDGANGNVEFGGLDAGTYTATVTGSDGTTVALDSIVVAECPFLTAAPTATATAIPCTPNSGMTDKVSVRVFNTDDKTNAAITYTITMGGQAKTVTVPDGANGNVEFGGLAAGTYTATVTGSDGTVTLDSIVVAECPFVAAAPTATATVIPCTLNSGTTSKVSVRVFNTDDGTDAAVTYTIEMGGQTKTVTVPDGENRNVEFGGLDAGTYTATVTGSDGTVTLDSVVVAECEIQVADITAAIVCTPNGVSITLTNAGNALGTVTINGMSHTVAAGASKEVSLPFDIGTPFQTVVTIDTIGQVKTQTVNCAPGQVLGNNTQNNGGQGGGHVLATSTVLPAMLPATGAKDSPYMILVAALIAYGATYFLQGRRKLLRNEA